MTVAEYGTLRFFSLFLMCSKTLYNIHNRNAEKLLLFCISFFYSHLFSA